MTIQNAEQLTSFKVLVKRRARMVWRLSTFLFLVLVGNLYLMSGGSDIGAMTLSPDGVVTVAFAYSVGVIILGASAAVFYVWWANKYLDTLVSDVKRELSSTGDLS